MKKVILALAIAAMSHPISASQTLGYTVAETIATTAVTFVTSDAYTFSMSDLPKMEAQKIQVEVQEFNQSGSISPFLAAKIRIVTNLDDSLSLEECVDVLLNASEIILAK